MPTHVKRTAEDKIEAPSAAKKAKVDGQATTQKELKDRLAAKLVAPQDKGPLSINRPNLK